MTLPEPQFGERMIAWPNIWSGLYPEDPCDPHDDHGAFTMQRLRGLVLAQAAEVEDVLKAILSHLDQTSGRRRRTAGQILRSIEAGLDPDDRDFWIDELDLFDRAIKCRNHIAHNRVDIGSVWTDYATGGGEWTPVVSTIGGELYDEVDLLRDLNLQQLATRDAVRLFHYLSSRGAADTEADDEGE